MLCVFMLCDACHVWCMEVFVGLDFNFYSPGGVLAFEKNGDATCTGYGAFSKS